MKLIDLAYAPDDYYLGLQQEIEALLPYQTLVFNCCELPPECTPSYTAINLKKDADYYVVFVDHPIRYTGRNRTLTELCNGEALYFSDMTMLSEFFRGALIEPEPPSLPEWRPPHSRPTAEDYDLDKIVDMADISLPQTTARSAPDYKTIQRELEKVIIGQETATETVAYQTALFLQKPTPNKPLSFVAYGPPGTGKSEMAKELSKVLSKLGPQQYANSWTDLNTFTEPHSVSRLLGSPPGYVGYDDTPVFETVAQNPYTVFIFDELDKAHPEVLKIFMSILDEGRCAARKELANHSREYDFTHCIFAFTSNYGLGTVPQKRIGFGMSEVEDVRRADGAIEVSYAEQNAEEEQTAITKRIYRNTEAARKAFVKAGILTEIASRFNCFVEFKELSAEAKVRILAKQVIETGFEYNIRLTHISSPILQALIDASTSEKALTVRSFKAVIEGYLASAFAEAGTRYGGQSVRLMGTIESPVLTLA